MIGVRHDAPSCADCLDTGLVADPRSADEDGAPDMLPCARCSRGIEEAEMLRGYDAWKCTPPVNERELEAEREAVELDEGERPPTPAAGKLAWPLQEEDIAW